MAAAELELKSPFVTFQTGEFLHGILTPLWKRREGEISDGMTRELCSELLTQDTSAALGPGADPGHRVARRRGD